MYPYSSWLLRSAGLRGEGMFLLSRTVCNTHCQWMRSQWSSPSSPAGLIIAAPRIICVVLVEKFTLSREFKQDKTPAEDFSNQADAEVRFCLPSWPQCIELFWSLRTVWLPTLSVKGMTSIFLKNMTCQILDYLA